MEQSLPPPLGGINPANTLILDLYFPELWEKTFLFFKLSDPRYFIMAAPGNQLKARYTRSLTPWSLGTLVY